MASRDPAAMAASAAPIALKEVLLVSGTVITSLGSRMRELQLSDIGDFLPPRLSCVTICVVGGENVSSVL